MTTRSLRSREEIRQLTMHQAEEEQRSMSELVAFFVKDLTEKVMADKPKRFIEKVNDPNFEVFFRSIKFYEKDVEASKMCRIGALQAALEEEFKPAGWDVKVRPYFHRLIVELGEAKQQSDK